MQTDTILVLLSVLALLVGYIGIQRIAGNTVRPIGGFSTLGVENLQRFKGEVWVFVEGSFTTILDRRPGREVKITLKGRTLSTIWLFDTRAITAGDIWWYDTHDILSRQIEPSEDVLSALDTVTLSHVHMYALRESLTNQPRSIPRV